MKYFCEVEGKMKRKIVNHWTASGFAPNKDDLLHYHFLIDCCGKVYKGVFPVSANDDCKDNNYAAHVGGLNTNHIGVALCGMESFVSPQKTGNYKLTKIQIEKLFELNAMLIKTEGWSSATEENLITHYEIGKKVLSEEIPRTPLTAQNIGKIDIVYLPPYPDIKPDDIGNFIRGKTNQYLNNLNC